MKASPVSMLLRALLMGYFPFLALAWLGMVGTALYLTFMLIQWPILVRVLVPIIVVLIVPAVQVLWALPVLFVPLPQRDDMEIRLPRKKLRGLYDLVAKVARQQRIGAPQEIRMSAESVAHVFEDDDGKDVLVVGGLAIRLFSQESLEGIVAHELAHLKAGDTRLLRQARRRSLLMRVLDHELDEMRWANFNPLVWLVRLYHLVYRLADAAHSRSQEFAADQYSVAQSGAEATAAAFLRMYTVDEIPGLRLGDIADFNVNLRLPMADIYREQERRASRLTPAEWRKGCRKALNRTTGLFDSHPSLRERLRAIGVSADRALQLVVAAPGTPSDELFDNWPAIEKQLTDRLMSAHHEAHFLKREFAQVVRGRP